MYDVKIAKLNLANNWCSNKQYTIKINGKLSAKNCMNLGISLLDYHTVAKQFGGELYDTMLIFDILGAKQMYDWINSQLVMKSLGGI